MEPDYPCDHECVVDLSGCARGRVAGVESLWIELHLTLKRAEPSRVYLWKSIFSGIMLLLQKRGARWIWHSAHYFNTVHTIIPPCTPLYHRVHTSLTTTAHHHLPPLHSIYTAIMMYCKKVFNSKISMVKILICQYQHMHMMDCLITRSSGNIGIT